MADAVAVTPGNKMIARRTKADSGSKAPAEARVPLADIAPDKHSLFEDAFALVIGALLVSFGIELLKDAGLVSGGIAGVAFVLHYATGASFGSLFFVLNLPFYWLAFKRMGVEFTLKTFAAVALLAVLSDIAHKLIVIERVNPGYAAALGGVALGLGCLALARHRASLGGVGIFVLYLQEHFGWRAGKIQMAIDCAIVASAFLLIEPMQVAWSVLGAVIMNAIIALNHKPGRYMGF